MNNYSYLKGENNMKKSYKLEELRCPSCADKMERAICKIPGVEDVNINFMTSKIKIQGDENKFDEILNLAQKEISKIERNCKIVF